MTALLRAELIKLRTTRTFIALTAVALGTSLLIAVLVSVLSEPTEDSVLTDVFTADTSGLFIVILAIVGITGEWRHRTITSSLLAAPNRLRFLVAKTLAFAAAGLVLSLLISITIAIVGMIILSARDLPTPGLGELIGQIIRNAEVAALLGAFGLALGTLVRNQPVAIVGVLVLGLRDRADRDRAGPGRGRFTPFSALPAAIQQIPASDVGSDELDLLSPGLAVLAELAWIGVFFAAGAVPAAPPRPELVRGEGERRALGVLADRPAVARVHDAPAERPDALDRGRHVGDGEVGQRPGVAGAGPAGVDADPGALAARLEALTLALAARVELHGQQALPEAACALDVVRGELDHRQSGLGHRANLADRPSAAEYPAPEPPCPFSPTSTRASRTSRRTTSVARGSPSWRVWRWVVVAVVFSYAATRAGGALELLLVMIVFAFSCRAAVEALTNGDGLREWRQ